MLKLLVFRIKIIFTYFDTYVVVLRHNAKAWVARFLDNSSDEIFGEALPTVKAFGEFSIYLERSQRILRVRCPYFQISNSATFHRSLDVLYVNF
mmetsp:Transcript_82881/g.115141  ORF Transcript_82881/g.115141 Transcript_82881/m.115141 type:complete len:94 (+) Transcript_82881:367-648(+)